MSAIPLTAIISVAFLSTVCRGANLSFARQPQYNTSLNTSGAINTTAGNQTLTKDGCSPAFLKPNSSSECHRYYNHSDSLCNNTITADTLLYADEMQQATREYKLKSVRIKPETFKNSLPNPEILRRKRCFQIIQDVYCHHYFPRCDSASSIPQPQAICREACEIMNFKCKSEWLKLMHDYPGVTWYAQDEIGEKLEEHETYDSYKHKNILMKCTGLPQMDGPNIPECYIPKELLYDKTLMEVGSGSSNDCYYGNGYSYRGNVSHTKSGYECQSWSAQCPHRHFRTPDNYKELTEAGNACRNPGHQAPLGPWCYTTNPLVRWEYCNVTKCQQVDEAHGNTMTIKVKDKNSVPLRGNKPLITKQRRTNNSHF